MRLYAEVNEFYKNHIKEHPEASSQGAARMRKAAKYSSLYWDDKDRKGLYIPKIYDGQTVEDFKRICALTHSICSKVIREFKAHEDFRALYDFPEELLELIMLPAPYEGCLPIARFDIFYNEETGDFKFCELNTDGCAAMMRDLEFSRLLAENPAHTAALRKYDIESFELFDTWVKEFLELYRTYPKHVENPHVVITDYLEDGTVPDFEEFARHFGKAGVSCEIVDVEDLLYTDGALYAPSGLKVDAIYRRAVTTDVIKFLDRSRTLVDAVKDDAVFIAGAFDTEIVHTKWLFYILHLDRTKKILTDEEREFVEKHVPFTAEFSEGHISLEEVLANKDRYILKPMDSYASKGIYAAGHEYSQADWEKTAKELYGTGYICQEFCWPYQSENFELDWEDGKSRMYGNMPGLYTYRGRFAGVFLRLAEGSNIIVPFENERTLPALWVKGRR
ncbi:MAG: hypothetical protein K6G58_02770 [Lachnospiraceae bacterium]|nr:hypothetical protein [Lachnospiraceae bacterium]